MDKIVFDSLWHPEHVLIAKCSACGKELAREKWKSYFSFERDKSRLIRTIKSCKHCGALFLEMKKTPVWEKTNKKFEIIAKGKNGDFLIWKAGNVWKWRYRAYGELYANQIGRAASKAEAQKACAKHKEWIA